MLGHESAALTLDRYGHFYGLSIEAVGVAINALLSQECGQSVGTDAARKGNRPDRLGSDLLI